MTAGELTPEQELKALNAEIQRTIDKAAAARILETVPDGQTIRDWRKSTNLSAGAMAHALRCTKRHLLRVESGYPLHEGTKFLTMLRTFVANVRDGLAYIPPGVQSYPLPPRRGERYIGISKVVGAKEGEFRKCPECQEEKLFIDKRAIYCSRACKKAAERGGRSVGVQGNKKANGPTQRLVQCPSCGHVHPIAGHMVAKKELAQVQPGHTLVGVPLAALRARIAELERLFSQAYDAMRSEAMYCPWCTGHIGGLDDRHDAGCPALPLLQKEQS